MTPQELWNQYKKINPEIGDEIDAWAFGAEPDILADLVIKGIKTATASAYDLYEVDKETLPQVGEYDVLLNSQDEAVCILRTTKVAVVPFKDVSAEHAYKEGEGDRSLEYWRQVHEAFFRPYLEECQIPFTQDTRIVLEEFEVVYSLDKGEIG
ncbi:cytoplasmic protein [Streptococcus varani]|uniref:Cytoplasmic protein n=1 Tax=Streptococcus varani TaxID=1608583 RepID=A0A0E4CT35_9STRE|nr:ASCH domain-containing protein [Streptococcus varani]CQR25313.1 cytoplasmic protein [Streptococcus varani]